MSRDGTIKNKVVILTPWRLSDVPVDIALWGVEIVLLDHGFQEVAIGSRLGAAGVAGVRPEDRTGPGSGRQETEIAAFTEVVLVERRRRRRRRGSCPVSFPELSEQMPCLSDPPHLVLLLLSLIATSSSGFLTPNIRHILRFKKQKTGKGKRGERLEEMAGYSRSSSFIAGGGVK